MVSAESSCKMCGKCCHYEIPITLLDIHRMAKYLGIADRAAFENYIQDKVSPHSSLFMIRKDQKGACVFLTVDNKCAIHQSKPRSCAFYLCNLGSSKEILPWTATCTEPAMRADLWEQSMAAMVTKAYIRTNGATWNEANYYRAILSIYDNVVVSDSQKIKLAKNLDGTPVAMIYDCSQCEKQCTYAKETPVTLDDIRRITVRLGLSWKTFFREKIDLQPSVKTGCLKLIRGEHCIFFDFKRHCTIAEVRPMHCRFTPCPRKTETHEMMDCLFLGSGTVEEQFRHQVALAITRQYVAECGTKYNKHLVREMLGQIDRIAGNHTELEQFCQEIAPYRYVDDTLMILQHH